MSPEQHPLIQPSIQPLVVGPLTAYPFQDGIRCNDKPFHLPGQERKLLLLLMRNVNVIITYEDIMQTLGMDPTNVTRTHRRYIERLRKRLETKGIKGWLRTVPEVGVVFRPKIVASDKNVA